MPSASSKVATQFSTTEGQDHMKQVLLVVEKKIRNIEKKKGKLEGYKDLVKEGKELNDDQRQSLKHYDEVLGNLEFAKELYKTFQTLATDYAKIEKKRNKRELVLRQEQEQKTIQTILLLQNVLDNLGQVQIRADFESGKNGAIILSAQELTYLDEFYKIACPSREAEEDTQPKESYEKKRVAAGEHLSKYVRGDATKVCGTTYKELNALIRRIEECGYLDNIPDFTQEPVEEVAETELQDDEYLMPNPETLPAEDTPDEPTSLQPEVSLKAEVESIPVHAESAVPDPIDFPQETKAARDLDEVLKSVQGSFSFVQDPIDFDAPHLVDPAVVSVSQNSQSYHSQISYGTSVDAAMMEHPQSHQTLDSLQQSGGQVLDQHHLQGPSQSIPTQSSTEQSYNVDQESVLQSNTSTHTSSTYNQSSMAPDQYSNTDVYVTGGDQFPSATDQYSQSTDQFGSSRIGTATDYTQPLGSSSQYSNQIADSAFQQEPITQQGQLSSGAMSIPDPQTIALPTDSSQVTTQVTTQSIVSIPKSTMNASAPPFQSTMSYQMQSSPPIAPAVTQSQDAFQSMGSTQVTGTDSYGSTNRNSDQSSLNSADVSGSAYTQQYQQQQQQSGYRNNRGNRGNRGGVQNTGYRSNRGGQQYNRGFNQQSYMQRNSFQPRGSDVTFSTGNGSGNTMHASGAFPNQYRTMPDNGYQSFDRRTNMPRGGNPRGGRGQGPRPGYNNRGRGGFNKTQQLTA